MKKRRRGLEPPQSGAALRRLKSIPARQAPPSLAITRAFFTAAGDEPPVIATDVRPVRSGRGKGWQVTVTAQGTIPQLPSPPRLEIRRLAAPRRRITPGRLPQIVAPAYRPPWIPFEPAPKTAEPVFFPGVQYRGRRFEPLSIQGKDDRRTYNDTSYPWVCICRVTSGNRRGSGVLIGPRHVLTASHVVDWKAGWAVVELHRVDASFVSGSCCSRLSAFTKIDNVEWSTLDEDYAVLTLMDRLGDQFGWMGSRTYDSDWDEETWWRTIGYPGDIASGMRPVFEQDFDLDEDPLDYGSARAMSCGADLMKGHSGGPIFGFWGGMPFVVAVVSAEGDDDDNYCAGGSDLPDLVNQARALDP